MELAIIALAVLTAGTAWARVGDLRLQPCADNKLGPVQVRHVYGVGEPRGEDGTHDRPQCRVLQATASNRKPDPLFVLLGGPGEAAASNGPQWYVDDPIRSSRDIVLVDARGTGKSNGLHCPVPDDAPLQDSCRRSPRRAEGSVRSSRSMQTCVTT